MQALMRVQPSTGWTVTLTVAKARGLAEFYDEMYPGSRTTVGAAPYLVDWGRISP